MTNFFFNKLPMRRLHDSFYHDEELGLYISEEFSLSVPDDFSENILYKGRRVRYTRQNGILYIVLGRELVSINVILAAIVGPVPEYLMDSEVGDVEAVPHQTNQGTFEKGAYYLRNQNVDIYDAVTDNVIYNVTKGYALEMLDCRRSLVYDLVSERYSGRVGYSGYFLRPHSPGKFILPESVRGNDTLADTSGIFLLTKMEGNDVGEVIVTGNMMDIVEVVGKGTSNITLRMVQEYFKKNDLESGFYGWKIRRIDDIHGINVRFSVATDARGYVL